MTSRVSVRTGADRLVDEGFASLRGERVGFVVNHTAVTAALDHVVPLALSSGALEVVRIFSPEHGLWGEDQDQVAVPSRATPGLDVPVISLYGASEADLRPPPGLVADLDALVFDMQDVGARYYTYVWTLTYCMEVAREVGTRVVVLDRPNPLGGHVVQGNVQEPEMCSFVGRLPVATRHGMTVGELARYVHRVYGVGDEPVVVPLAGWRRSMWYDETGLPWVAPSPNMPALTTATLYPGGCLFEATNLSEGRGTTQPFELIGAPYVDPFLYTEALRRLDLPGVAFRPHAFRPTFNKYAGELCRGVQVHVVDREAIDAIDVALAMIGTARRLWPEGFRLADPPYEFEYRRMPLDLLTGRPQVRRLIEAGAPHDEVRAAYETPLAPFLREQERLRLY